MNIQTIRFRLIALGVTLVLLSAALRLLIAFPPVKALLRDLVATQQLSIASYVARDVERSIEERKAAIELVAESLPLDLLDRPRALSQWLEERHRLLGSFKGGLYLIGTDGSSLLAGGPRAHDAPQIDLKGVAWFLAALTSHGPVLGSPEQGLLIDAPSIAFAMPVRGTDGRALAVLAGLAKLDASGFLSGLQQHTLGKGGGLLLISPADNVLVSGNEPLKTLQPAPVPDMKLLQALLLEGYGTRTEAVGIMVGEQGDESLSAMAGVPGTGWFVVAHLPAEEAFAPIQLLQSMVLNSTGVALVIVLGALLLLLSRILTPLTRTASAIRDMADGKRELGPLTITRHDEVGKLIVGFNKLVDRLREKEAILKETEARLSFMAHHDTLTGLLNRGILEDRLDQALDRAARNGIYFAVLFLDLDWFKPINDQWGHDVGDAVLVQVAERLTHQRRRTDTVARLGGDEFVVLLNDLDDVRSDARRIAEQYVLSLQKPYRVGGLVLELSVSIGVAVYEGGSLSASQLLSQADIAMYRAKREGKNAYCFYEKDQS